MVKELNLDLLKIRQEPTSVILVEPNYFQVVDQKNPYMKGSIDIDLAQQQWRNLKAVYQQLASDGTIDKLSVIPGVENCEDMVFCANQSLPWNDEQGDKQVVLSNMRYPSRQREVKYFEEFYQSKGYGISYLPKELLIEGMGDCIFHPFTELLWMGYGYRTSLDAAAHLEATLKMPVLPLKLKSEYFYHLDTCFLPVDDETILLCPDAFDVASMNSIRSVFRKVVEVSKEEASETFCLNTHCIYDRDHPVAITPSGDHVVKGFLLNEGFRVIEVDTSEFIKSGGSIYCMKMMYYD